MSKPDVTLLDGASGTRLWALAEAAGLPKEPTWRYNLSRPELVTQVGREYAEAGSEILLANTFAANRLSLKGEADVAETVRAGVACAREAAGGRCRVALDVGPLAGMLEPYGDLEEAETEAVFAEQIDAGADAGADLILLETFMDVRMLRCAMRAARRHPLPLLCSMTFRDDGRSFVGDSPEDLARTAEELGADAVGMNCSPTPDIALPILRRIAAATTLPLLLKPNAGLPVKGPDGTSFPYTAQMFADAVAPALELPRLRYLGACCGSTPEFIRALKQMI